MQNVYFSCNVAQKRHNSFKRSSKRFPRLKLGQTHRAVLFCLVLALWALWAAGSLVGQQQNSPQVGGRTEQQNSNFGTPPPTRSFDQQTNPLNYTGPEQILRNTISTSAIGLSQGFIYIEWEHLFGRTFGMSFGLTLYASEMGATRRLFSPAGIDDNNFLNLGGMLGFVFYMNQQYARGAVIQIKFGGGLLSGSYTEDGATAATAIQDFYGSLIIALAYRINLSQRVALSPIVVLNPNLIIVNGTYDNKLTVPGYYFINGHSDMFGLAVPAEVATFVLFMHFGLGFDLTFTF